LADAKAVSNLYTIVSLEKCLGKTDTETAIYDSAALLKSFNPQLKVFFYLATDLGGLQCYSHLKEWLANPQWWLRNDSGEVMNQSNIPLMDYTNAEARNWWVGIPLNGTGSPAAHLIDGVLADGSGPPACPGIGSDRCAALAAGKAVMVDQLQGLFNSTNGGTVLQNLLSFYPPPSSPVDHGLSWLKYSNGAMAEHFAVFESVLPSGKLNVSRVVECLDTVSAAAAAGKLTVFAAWPGLLDGFGKDGWPTWPGNTQPTTMDGWRAALLQKHTFAFAGFLTVAEENVFLSYIGAWYNGFLQGAVPCPDDLSSCAAPSPWYPDLFKPLGAPLGPAVRTGNVFTRHFERAVSVLDLDNPDASSVTFL